MRALVIRLEYSVLDFTYTQLKSLTDNGWYTHLGSSKILVLISSLALPKSISFLTFTLLIVVYSKNGLSTVVHSWAATEPLGSCLFTAIVQLKAYQYSSENFNTVQNLIFDFVR